MPLGARPGCKKGWTQVREFRWVFDTCGPDLRRVWVLCATRCASALIAVCYALLMQRSVDAAVSHDVDAFLPALALFSAALLVQVLLSMASRWLSESAQARLENALRTRAVGAVVRAGRLPGGRASGEVASVMTSDIACVAGAVVSVIPDAASMLVRGAAALVLMFAVAPALAALFVVAGTLGVLCSLVMRRWLKSLHAEAQAAEGSMRARLQETLESLVVIRSFGAATRVLEGLGALMNAQLAARERRAGGKAVSGAIFNLAMQLSYLAGFGYGCWGILTGRVSYGTLMALVQLVGQVRAPFASLSGLFPQTAAMSASCERLRASAPSVRIETLPPDGFSFGALCFHGAQFGYTDGLQVLKGFNAEIRNGEFIAITGPSGIGKSTMLMLALGMEDPSAGTVEIEFVNCDGSAEAISASELAPGTFAYVPQGNMLMSGSICEAITLAGDATVDHAALANALYAACASEFVDALPAGIDSQLGEHGSGLSEGQMQRLAVARAVYSGAPVLLLDECTSALDEAIEREMLNRLRELGRTVVIVTHRPAALDICDRTICLS